MASHRVHLLVQVSALAPIRSLDLLLPFLKLFLKGAPLSECFQRALYQMDTRNKSNGYWKCSILGCWVKKVATREAADLDVITYHLWGTIRMPHKLSRCNYESKVHTCTYRHTRAHTARSDAALSLSTEDVFIARQGCFLIWDLISHYKTEDIPLIRLHSLIPIVSHVRRMGETGNGVAESNRQKGRRRISGGQFLRKIVFIGRYKESLKLGGNEMG